MPGASLCLGSGRHSCWREFPARLCPASTTHLIRSSPTFFIQPLCVSPILGLFLLYSCYPNLLTRHFGCHLELTVTCYSEPEPSQGQEDYIAPEELQRRQWSPPMSFSVTDRQLGHGWPLMTSFKAKLWSPLHWSQSSSYQLPKGKPIGSWLCEHEGACLITTLLSQTAVEQDKLAPRSFVTPRRSHWKYWSNKAPDSIFPCPPPPSHLRAVLQGLFCCSRCGQLLRIRLPPTSLQMKERHSWVTNLLYQVSYNMTRCQFTSSTHVHVHVCAYALLGRMLVGESSTVLIFRVRCSFLCTTVKSRRMNKTWELEIWDI